MKNGFLKNIGTITVYEGYMRFWYKRIIYPTIYMDQERGFATIIGCQKFALIFRT